MSFEIPTQLLMSRLEKRLSAEITAREFAELKLEIILANFPDVAAAFAPEPVPEEGDKEDQSEV